MLIIITVILAVGANVIGTLENASMGDCGTGVRNQTNTTSISGSGTVYLILSSRLHGNGNLTIYQTGGTGNLTVNNCFYNLNASNPYTLKVPKNCMATTTAITYAGVDVQNTTLYYPSLEGCALGTNAYNALSGVTTTYWSLQNIMTPLLLLLALAFIIAVFMTLRMR